MILHLKCKACGQEFDFTEEYEGQSLYGMVYVASARHERGSHNKDCFLNAAKHIVLTGVDFA